METVVFNYGELVSVSEQASVVFPQARIGDSRKLATSSRTNLRLDLILMAPKSTFVIVLDSLSDFTC